MSGPRTMRLRVDPIACDGRGVCAELLPELISVDDWGFPIVSDDMVPDDLVPIARRAVAACPLLALHLDRSSSEPAAMARRPGVSNPPPTLVIRPAAATATSRAAPAPRYGLTRR